MKRLKMNTIFMFIITMMLSFVSVGYSALSQNVTVSGDVDYNFLVKAENLSYNNSNSGLTSTNAQDAIDELTVLSRTCGGVEDAIYRFTTASWSTSENISSYTVGTDYVRYKPQLSTMNTLATKFFLKYHINNNLVTDKYVCFVITNTMVQESPGMTAGEYCLKGGDGGTSFLDNAKIIYDAYGSNCTSNPYITTPSSYFECNTSNVLAGAGSNGVVSVSDPSWYCLISADGSSGCRDD